MRKSNFTLKKQIKTKTALALLYDEALENAYDVRLKLTKEVLTIQKQDVVCIGGAPPGANVNGINVENATHEEVVHLLRTAGDDVTITVEYLREAPSFLKLPLGSPGPSSDHSSRASSPLFDSGLHLNGHCSHTAPSSPSSPIANEPKYEKRWLDTLSVPLSMARISRYKAGAEKLRSSAFEVLALDGTSTGVLQFSTNQDCADWLRAISANISDLTLQHVVHMGWVNERLQRADDTSQIFRSKFLALKGSSFFIFSTPPVSTLDWGRAERAYNLCEVLFKVHKFWLSDNYWLQANFYLGLHDFDCEDPRPYCFSVLASHGKSHNFSVELGSELAVWEKSFQRATFMEVQRTGSKTYLCSWQGEMLCFTVDFALGFTCFDGKTKNVLWRFKFSQLKGSSDDGKTRVKLLFQNLDTKQIETKDWQERQEAALDSIAEANDMPSGKGYPSELEFQDLTAVLHCIHSFIAAKVASLDPAFMDSQSMARRYMCSS
ncbi:syntrophin gamma 2 [Cricetulus griseus]